MTIGKLHLPALLIVLLAGLLLQWTDLPAPSDGRTGPRTMKEVIGIIQRLGLHCRSDRQDGIIGWRLVVSESPLTWQRANDFTMVPQNDTDWNGMVTVLRDSWIMPDQRLEAWGNFFVYGDRSLIKRLTATATSEDRRP